MGWRLASHAKAPQGVPVFGSPHVHAVQWFDTGTAANLTQAVLASGPLGTANLTAAKVNNASFAVTVNGATVQVGPLDLHLASDFSVIAAAIDANMTAATCEWTGTKLLIITDPAAASTISFGRAPAAGTDVSTILCLTSATYATIGP